MAGDIQTMGDLRRFIIDVMLDCRAGSIEVSRAQTIVAGGKVVNDNLMAEVALNKLAMEVRKVGVDSIKIVDMGRRLITGPSPASVKDGES